MPSLFPRVLLCLLFVSAAARAQELPFAHFTPNDQVSPLPSASVQQVLQDHLGYIWLAFYSSGLTRYDGHSMENYSLADGLADLTVRDLATPPDLMCSATMGQPCPCCTGLVCCPTGLGLQCGGTCVPT